jgi:predicted nucleic acid-binding protein
VKAFFNSNVVLYAFSGDSRRGTALAVTAQGGVISAQTLNEFTNVMRRKLRLDWDVIEAAIDIIRGYFDVIVPLTDATHAIALPLARDHGFAFHDAQIIASALEAGCDTLYREDMQDGRVIGDLIIRNPFREGDSRTV